MVSLLPGNIASLPLGESAEASEPTNSTWLTADYVPQQTDLSSPTRQACQETHSLSLQDHMIMRELGFDLLKSVKATAGLLRLYVCVFRMPRDLINLIGLLLNNRFSLILEEEDQLCITPFLPTRNVKFRVSDRHITYCGFSCIILRLEGTKELNGAR